MTKLLQWTRILSPLTQDQGTLLQFDDDPGRRALVLADVTPHDPLVRIMTGLSTQSAAASRTDVIAKFAATITITSTTRASLRTAPF